MAGVVQRLGLQAYRAPPPVGNHERPVQCGTGAADAAAVDAESRLNIPFANRAERRSQSASGAEPLTG
jgi:hypothetical protein